MGNTSNKWVNEYQTSTKRKSDSYPILCDDSRSLMVPTWDQVQYSRKGILVTVILKQVKNYREFDSQWVYVITIKYRLIFSFCHHFSRKIFRYFYASKNNCMIEKEMIAVNSYRKQALTSEILQITCLFDVYTI